MNAFLSFPFVQDFDSWFDTNNCLGDTKLVERLHTVSAFSFDYHVDFYSLNQWVNVKRKWQYILEMYSIFWMEKYKHMVLKRA